jgi:hypothetical protein
VRRIFGRSAAPAVVFATWISLTQIRFAVDGFQMPATALSAAAPYVNCVLAVSWIESPFTRLITA